MEIPVESFYLPEGGGGSLQQRIRQMVAEGILAGRFRAADRMPSSRGLAAHLGVSRITVTLAYTELVAADYLTARGRSGYFVSEGVPVQPEFRPVPKVESSVDWEALCGGRFSRMERVERPEDWRSYPYPFIYGQADPALFDHQNWRLCALQALGRREFETLTADRYERDDPLLIEYLLRNILPRRGIEARPSEVLVTMGAQNALWLAAQVLLRPGGHAVVENPGYPGFRAMCAQAGARVTPVAVDEGGLSVDSLPAGVDVVFTTASHQSPTNATMPVARRTALLRAAEERNFLVVEDDYEFEMSFLKPVSPSIKSLDSGGRVVHAGSFSKSIFPGLRLGWLVGPEPFIREARALRAQVLRHPPGQLQRTTAHFLSLGHYDALVNRMKAAFAKRRKAMEEAISQHDLKVAGQGGFGGSSFWMEAAPHMDTEEMALRLRAEGVLIEPGRVFFHPGTEERHFFRLAYSSIPVGKIPEGIALVARAMRGM
ncbi:PLP-dependent aminotransferase family protein [Rhodobacter sp. HX-7-19]|uniref:PLP-dependent aminotransferase family protein n=1 Tax=Paragemmobacter kunshanensis TaxID=2583234 RepID=A0A6M1TUF6_9RHOB|nr:PLP-dependent aminotransferase family protein [Rhodobacter kunshanensis]NGQ91367.1 PLP-dependent aminotransferase family protein [Rhodobacter kunshanensis]